MKPIFWAEKRGFEPGHELEDWLTAEGIRAQGPAADGGDAPRLATPEPLQRKGRQGRENEGTGRFWKNIETDFDIFFWALIAVLVGFVLARHLLHMGPL